jgi:hypothetical protein
MLLFLGILMGGSALIRRIQYQSYRLALVGLRADQKKALLHLLQYKYLFGYDVGAYELAEIEQWACNIRAYERQVPIIKECRSLHIPEWRIQLASNPPL